MATFTRIQLVNQALRDLQVVGAGQEPDDEDFDVVDAKVDSLTDQLSADNICDVSDIDEIPGEWFDAIAQLLAVSCSTMFGLQIDGAKKEYFEQLLRRVTMARPSYEPAQADYY